MDGVGHSTLLKFFVDNIKPNKVMSEQSPTIESAVPGLQKLRNVSETTCTEPEWQNTSDKRADDGNTTEVHNFNEGRDEVLIHITKETEQRYTIDEKKYDETYSAKGEDDNYKYFVKSPVADEKEKSSTDEKGESLTTEENAAPSKDAFVYSPVITVTKEELTLTKGDLKLQKVVVSEDISDESTSKNGKLSVIDARNPTEKHNEIQSEVFTLSIRTDKNVDENNAKEKKEDDAHKDPKTKQTKIPKLRFKQVIEKIRKENQVKRNKKDFEAIEQKRRSSIPRLKDIKNPTQNIKQDLIQNKKDQEIELPKADDEFDKLYEEIIESEASNNIPSPEKISDPIKLESKFEEIIHAYDENNVQPISTEKVKSKIPLLKRKSEQEIEIPPPSHHKILNKKFHSEDSKNKVPVTVSKEKYVKSDVGTVKHEDSSTSKISETGSGTKTEVIPKHNTPEKQKSVNTTLAKKITTQRSVEAKNHVSSLPMEVVVKSDDRHIKVKESIKCKIPVTLNAKDALEMKINSASLNKYPTRINVNGKISRPSNAKEIDANKPVDKVSQLPENKEHFIETKKMSNLTTETLNDDTTTTSETDDSKIPYELPSKNEKEHNFTVKNNLGDNVPDVKESKGDLTVKEPTALNVGVQLLKKNSTNDDIVYVNKFETDPLKDGKMHSESKEIKVDNERGQIVNKIELTLESPIRTITNENNTTKEGNPDTESITTHIQQNDNLNRLQQIPINTSDVKVIVVKDPLESNVKVPHNNQTALESDNKQMFSENPLDKGNIQEKYSIQENLPLKETDIEDKQEEDIIMLKGKVDRVIRRLDSKDHKTIKKEPDDVPKEVSVISKIALFERSDMKDQVSRNDEVNTPSNEDMVTDKPKVVNDILKTDINQNEINHSDNRSVVNVTASEDTVNNDKAIIRNDLEIKKVNNTITTNVFKLRNSLSEGKISRTVSTIAGENDVFADKQEQSKEVWKEYRRKKEVESDMRRARSLAELDGDDAVRGRVRQMVLRMSSVERPAAPREGAARGRPRGGSVAERIALYERKLTPTRGAARPAGPAPPPAPLEARGVGGDELRARLAQLSAARATYGRRDHVPWVELSDGGKMPALALGTAMLEPALVRHVVHAAIELGYRAIDAAYIYGNEREVGAAICDKIRDGTVTRSELFIINKLWSTWHGRELAQQACRQSLQTMGLDYFDLYLIHNPMSFKEGPNPLPRIAGVLQYSEHDYLEAWFGVEALVAGGLARRGGLSNFNSQQVARVLDKARIKPVINQVECHPYLTQLRLEEFCLSRNIKLSCFGVLGSKGTPTDLTSGLPPVIDDPLVQVMAAGLGVTPAQLLISYQVQLGRGVVVKCSSAAHLAEALAAASAGSSSSPSSPALPKLQASHVAALNALNRNKRIFTFKGMGDTHKNYPFKIPF